MKRELLLVMTRWSVSINCVDQNLMHKARCNGSLHIRERKALLASHLFMEACPLLLVMVRRRSEEVPVSFHGSWNAGRSLSL